MFVCAFELIFLAQKSMVVSALEQIPPYVWLILIGAVVIPPLARYYKPRFKGWLGERMVRSILSKLPNDYKLWHDVYLLDSEGHTTQIDHLVASIYGIFVIETKNYKGWIYGSERQKNWTQNIYGKKHKFQNPIHQNARHIRVLAEVTSHNKKDFVNVVIFIGDATIKTDLPSNVMTKGIQSFIQSSKDEILSQSSLETFCSRVDQASLSGEKGIAKRHLKSLDLRKSLKNNQM